MAKAPSKIERSLATASSVYTFWPLLPAGLVGVVTGYLSSTVGWINDLGWFGWWSASLLGCLMASGIYFAIGAGRQKWEIAKQIKERGRKFNAVNPLDAEFHKVRINLADFILPSLPRIADKSFTDCEIVGPAVVGFGSNMTLLSNVFAKCDFIATKKNLALVNAIHIYQCKFVNCKFVNLTLMLHPDLIPLLEKDGKGPYYASLTGNDDIDARTPL